MSQPILRAIIESGATTDDPSEDGLFLVLQEVESGSSSYVILERVADESQQTYAQAAREDDGTYVVEYRDGGPARHFGTVAADVRAAHALLTNGAFDVPGWRESAEWQPVTF